MTDNPQKGKYLLTITKTPHKSSDRIALKKKKIEKLIVVDGLPKLSFLTFKLHTEM